MFANLLQLVTRRTPPEFEHSFVQDVSVTERSPRNLRIERLILVCWVLILAKSFLVIWLVDKYHLGFNADWIIVPTVLAALLCTAVYFWRD
jgi:peptidoglycan/LPS O-acetylase OafA/YrhL